MKNGTLIVRLATLALMLVAGVAHAVSISSVGSGYWTNPASWSPAQVPTSADDVTITNGCTVTNNDVVAHPVGNLTIQSGGVLTHTANGSTEAYKVILNIATNLTIAAGGQINVDAKGRTSPNLGSYGGIGGSYGSSFFAGPTYGSITAPTNLGSGGFQGTAGGGAVILNVTGTSTLSGTISVNGGPGSWSAPGGSVFITTGTISGSPTISANGSTGSGGGNGGGRVAIILTGSGADFSSFGGATISAYGGGGSVGAAGTIYRETQAQAGGQGEVTIDNNNSITGPGITTAIPSNQTWIVPFITLNRGGNLGIPTNVTFDLTGKTVTGDSVNQNAGITLQGGTLITPAATPAAFSYTNYFIRYLSASTFNPTSLTLGTNAQFICDVPYTLPSNLTVQSGGTLTHDANNSTEAYKLNLAIGGDFTLHSGGTVNVDAKGRISPNLGSYGGIGGSYGVTYSAGPTYGSITAPTNLGSGGFQGTAGGGAAILNVTGASALSGTISANGGPGSWSAPGGSVYIRTKTITGSPTITANGSTGSGGGNGGGRIAVILTGSGADFSGFGGAVISAYGGGGSVGAAGTIYKETQAQAGGQGVLTIDNNNNVTASNSLNTLISSNVTDTIVGTIIITNRAILAIETNQSLTVNGSWMRGTNTSFIASSNSTVSFTSTNTATITGSNTFYNLTAGAAGKTILFEAGKTNTVNGMLIFQKNTTLLSTTDGSQWGLNLANPGGTQQVGRVTVKDSNASGGQTIYAGVGSLNLLNNVNWIFPPGGTVFVVR